MTSVRRSHLMEKMRSLLIAFLLLVLLSPRAVQAEETATFNLDSYTFGYRPQSTRPQSIHDANEGGYSSGDTPLVAMEELPESYSSVDKGFVTSVKNQGQFGLCWAFAAIAASESSMLAQGIYDGESELNLSERQLAYFAFHPTYDPPGHLAGDAGELLYDLDGVADSEYLFVGGRSTWAALTLASWSGVTDEELAPYDVLSDAYTNRTSDEEFYASTALDASLSRDADVAHLESAHRIDLADRDEVKRAIMNSGAVSGSVLLSATGIKGDSSTVYNSDEYSFSNHAVALVGWDDCFPKERFGDSSVASPYGTDDPPSQFEEMKEGVPTHIDGPEGPAMWIEYKPPVDGYYIFASSGECVERSSATLYVKSPLNGLLQEVSEGSSGVVESDFSLKCALKADETYYLHYNYHSDSESFTVSVVLDSPIEADYEGFTFSEGDTQIPDRFDQIRESEAVAIDLTPSPTVKWLRCQPSSDGWYRFSTSGDSGPHLTLYRTDEKGGLLGLVSEVDGTNTSANVIILDANMQADGTYFLKCEARCGSSFDVSLNRLGDIGPIGCPANDGAWLAKNSWGDSFGEDGFFWISYEDVSLDRDGVFVFNFEPADNHENIYEYDPTNSETVEMVRSGGGFANVFTTQANDDGTELLEAVSFWMSSVNVDYSIQIYTDVQNEKDPTSGNPVFASPITDKTSFEGYYTVHLPEPIELQQGESYSVVIDVSHRDGSYVFFGVDQAHEGALSSYKQTAQMGRSFMKRSEGSGWVDLADETDSRLVGPGAARIKAFTNNVYVERPLSEAEISIDNTMTYSGSPLTPDVVVVLGEKTLVRGIDYTVLYSDNTNVGTAKVTITGKRGYTGSRTLTFEVVPRNLADLTIAEIEPCTYSGLALEPPVMIRSESVVLELESDYSLTYENNTNVGTAQAIIVGKGNYAGRKVVEFQIEAADLACSDTERIADQVYTGSAITPVINVSMNGKTLVEGADYGVTYSDNIEVGLARVIIMGIGNYAGTKTITFSIVPSAPFFVDADPADAANHGVEVDWMGRLGISTGWEVAGGREFRGMQEVKRCDFAAFLYRLADLSDDGVRNDSCALPEGIVAEVLAGVSDCGAKTPHAAEVAWMVSAGISRGWSDRGRGTVSFRPMADVARQDMAAFLYRFADLADDGVQDRSPAMGPESVTFSDVRHGDEANHASEVEWLASVGVTKGWQMKDGTYQFRGTRTVARQDMAAFMYRLNSYLNR